jgi:Arc/MetJ-type ribon-helix-helix transcriptional regulator
MKVTTVRLPDDLAEAIEQAADETERSQSDYIRHALRSHIEAEENTSRLEERIDELEERIKSLEKQSEQTHTGEAASRTRSNTRDPWGESREDRSAEQPSSEAESPTNLSEDINALVLPGSADSPEGRRAVRALYEYTRREGRAQKSDFLADVYPEHPVGYGSEESWWKGIGREAEGTGGFKTLAQRRDDLRPPEGRGSQYFEFIQAE